MNSTRIAYGEVKSAVSQLRDECLPRMRNIFDSFDKSVKGLKDDGVFVGEAADSYDAKSEKLRSRFKDFENLVLRFASEFEMAAESTKETEKRAAASAEQLNS